MEIQDSQPTFRLENLDFDKFVQALSIPTEESLKILQDIQKDNFGWELAIRLLKTNSDQCMFFGAHTLQVKINRDWFSLGELEKEQLKNELVSSMKSVPLEKFIVISKLCQAITTYQVQMSNENKLVSIFSVIGLLNAPTESDKLESGNLYTSNGYVAEYLSTFPEEVLRISISSSKHPQLFQDVQDSILKVFEFLGISVSSTSTNTVKANGSHQIINERAWSGLKCWIQLANLQNETQQRGVSSLVQLASDRIALAIESNNQSVHGALDSKEIASIIEFLDEVFGSHQIYKSNPQKMGELGLLCFSQPWMQQAVYSCLNENEYQFPNQWGSLISTYTELYIYFCLKSLDNENLKKHMVVIWETMLAIVGANGRHGEDSEPSYQIINFWSLLEEGWADYQDTLQDEGSPDITAKVENTRKILEDLFFQYVSRIFTKTQFPTFEIWTNVDKETKEQFYVFRREVMDSILASYRILGDKMLSELVRILVEIWTSGNIEQISNWQPQEARLFIMRSISEETLSQPRSKVDVFLMQLFEIALDNNAGIFLEILRNNHFPQVFHTAIINLIGSYSEYLNDRPEFIVGAVKCYTSVISNPKLAAVVTKSFKSFCESCTEPLRFFAQDLALVATELLEMDGLESKDIQRVFSSVSSIMGALSATEKIKYANQMMGKLLNCVERELSIVRESPDQLEHYLSLISELLIGLQTSETEEVSALTGDAEAISLLKVASQQYFADSELLAAKSRLYTILLALISSDAIKNEGIYSIILAIINETIRKGPHPFGTQLDSVLSMFAGIWNKLAVDIESTDLFALSKIFSSLAQVVTVYSKGRLDWQGQECLTSEAAIEKLSTFVYVWLDSIIAMKSISMQKNIPKFDQVPPLAEKIFNFLDVLVTQCPSSLLFIKFELVVQLIMWSYTYYYGIDRLALSAATRLMTSLILQIAKVSSKSVGDIGLADPVSLYYIRLLDTISANFVLTVINAIAISTPRSLIPTISTLFLLFIKNNMALTRTLLNELLLGSNGLSIPNVDQTEKSKFINSVLGTRSVFQFKNITNSFAAKVRGLAY